MRSVTHGKPFSFGFIEQKAELLLDQRQRKNSRQAILSGPRMRAVAVRAAGQTPAGNSIRELISSRIASMASIVASSRSSAAI